MSLSLPRLLHSVPAGLAAAGRYLPVVLLLLALLGPSTLQSRDRPSDEQIIGEFLLLLLGSDQGKQEALNFIEANWEDEFAPMLLEVVTFNRDPAFGPKLVAQLERGTGQSLGFDIEAWQAWLWNREAAYRPYYADFKSALYGLLDERFEAYFGRQRPAQVRLDEVVWGGVGQDGIPPLRYPDMIPAAEADYLLVVNASNRQKDWRHLEQERRNFPRTGMTDRTLDLAMLSLQGPLAKKILSALISGRLPEPMRNFLSNSPANQVQPPLQRSFPGAS